jgi:hypothetical protein
MVVEWLQMALTRKTGLSSHHIILLWPFPLVFLGIAFSAMADRLPRYGAPALAALVVFLAAENLLTSNEYLTEFAVNGPAGGWTDAISPLSKALTPRTAAWLGLVDWGYLTQPRMLHEGDLNLFGVDAADPAEMQKDVTGRDLLFIQHTRDKEMPPSAIDNLRRLAEDRGYSEHIEAVIRDRNGRPVFELFRFVKAAPR